MIGDVLQPTHLIFILVIALLVLGPKRLPEVGRSLGKGLRDFRGALSGITEPDEEPASNDFSTQVTPVTPATTTLPAEDTTATPSFSAEADHSEVGHSAPGTHEASGREQAAAPLPPHIEPDEIPPVTPAVGPSHPE